MQTPALDLSGIAAAIVDLDGTMVDTVGDFEQALGRTLADLALPPVDRAFIARTVGRGSMHLLTQTLAQVGGAPELLQAAWTLYQRHYAEVNGQHAQVYPGVREGWPASPTSRARSRWPCSRPRACCPCSSTRSAAIRSSARSPIRCPWSRPARCWARGHRRP
jgi:beta-phosphoglucomutase-like phosphatase (HAD superfamily)